MLIGTLLTLAIVVAGSPAIPVLAGDKAKCRTVKGRDSGTFTLEFRDDGLILGTTHATGRARGWGRYTLFAQELADPLTGEVTDGTYTITTANGDEIYGEYAGNLILPDPNPEGYQIGYDVTGPITGGTGRFEGATGEISFLGFGYFDGPASGTAEETLTGTICLGEDQEDDSDEKDEDVDDQE
jgi:hypothetical protein